MLQFLLLKSILDFKVFNLNNCLFKNGYFTQQDPIPFMQNIQRNRSGDWHIPYYKKEDLTSKTVVDNFHRHWLCLTNQPPLQQVINIPLTHSRSGVSNLFHLWARLISPKSKSQANNVLGGFPYPLSKYEVWVSFPRKILLIDVKWLVSRYHEVSFLSCAVYFNCLFILT